jgi:transposase
MEGVMTMMIGIDPHKASHTAVALTPAETVVGEIKVRATSKQVKTLLSWAEPWPERIWAIEGASGLGRLLAQQLIAAGQTVLDVQPKLAARARLLNTGQVNKNDPNDARSVGIAALRSPDVRAVQADDRASVMQLWVRRNRDLSRTYNRIACRLHALLCDLVPGGFAKQITPNLAAALLAGIDSTGDPVRQGQLELAEDLVADLRRVAEQRRAVVRRLAEIVAASGTTLTQIYGVGPVVAATVLGDVGLISRFRSRDHFASYNGTAPIEASSGGRTVHRLSRRGNRHLNHAIHMAAVAQIRYPNTVARAYYDRKRAEGMSGKSALRAFKRRISDALYARMIADAQRAAAGASTGGPGWQTGNDSASSATGSHPEPALRKSHSRTAPKPRTTRSYKPIPAPAKPRRRTT